MAAGGEVDQSQPAFRDPNTGSVFVTIRTADGTASVQEIKLTDKPSVEFANASRAAERERTTRYADADDNVEEEEEDCVIM